MKSARLAGLCNEDCGLDSLGWGTRTYESLVGADRVGSKTSIRYALAATLMLAALAAEAGTAASARSMYASARAREDALRSAWRVEGKAGAKTPGLSEVRTVIEMYRAIVRRYPRSGYADNALYQAAGLASEAYTRFRSETERNLAVELLRRMVKEYPSSSLVPAAQILIGDLETLPSGSRRPTAVAAAPETSARTRDAGETATLLAVEHENQGDHVSITLRLDRPARYTLEQIEGPPRLVLDFTDTTAAEHLRHAALSYGEQAIRSVRLGQRGDTVTRVVLDLGKGVEPSVSTRADPYRVVVYARVTGPGPAADSPTEAAADKPAPLASSHKGESWAQLAPAVASNPVERPEGSAAGQTATARPQEPTSAATENTLPSGASPAVIERPPKGPTGSKGTGFSMARQLGLNVARIVIDPGHGGHDPGAKTRTTTEAKVVLDVALRLEALLLKQPAIEVVLTRRTDVFVPLEERTAIANRERADLFLSIHANASRRTAASGIETYLLDFASNADAAEVAARENMSSGLPISTLPEIVRAITLTNKLDESRIFATQVQQALYQHLRTVNRSARNLGVKRAPFVVLIGATMPSILAEVSFLTNAREGQLLSTPTYRQKIAEALFEGIQRYRKALASAVVVTSR